MYKHILLAIDGSENSFRAAKDAVGIATEDSLIEIISSIPTEAISNEPLHMGTLTQTDEQYIQKLSREIDYVKSNHPHLKLTIVHGPAGRMISNYANHHNVDLVVIGCRGLNTMQEMVFGSVSTYVSKNANCSTLLVK
ncbi:universal stress protein [Solibacillus sp. FSL W8-0474]|uniref:universal stress protein n=1 Tax=Solibacillus sp. FSL W8-0474 TaxID=2975336 RepID=UPI0030F96BAF